MSRPIDADRLLDDITAAEEHGGMGAVVAGTLRRYLMRQPTLTPPNEPLTLEQLREMDGEPVYIIAKDMGIAEWNVITGKEPIAIAYDCPMPGFKSVVEGIAFANGRAFRAGAYGITWLAYRRPPEGEA